MLALPENLPRIKPATIEQAMSDVFPAISTVRKYHGEQTAFAAVVEIIAQAATLVNVGKNLQPHQIEFLTFEILREWYWLTIGEVRFVMERGVRGLYGALYDRLDTNTVLEWFDRFEVERMGVGERYGERKEADECVFWKKQAAENRALKPIPKEVVASIENLQNRFLVDGEAKKGIKTGEFEPDEHVFRMLEMEWADLPEKGRLPFENYKVLRVAQIKAQMKR